MKKVKFEDVPVGRMFYFNVMDGIGKNHRFMKVRDAFHADKKINAVWMTKERGLLCHFNTDSIVELEGE